MAHAPEVRVVHHHVLAVLGDVHVELEHVGADRQRALVGEHRVRRELALAALVGDVHLAPLEPRVVGGGRRGGQHQEQGEGQQSASHEGRNDGRRENWHTASYPRGAGRAPSGATPLVR